MVTLVIWVCTFNRYTFLNCFFGYLGFFSHFDEQSTCWSPICSWRAQNQNNQQKPFKKCSFLNCTNQNHQNNHSQMWISDHDASKALAGKHFHASGRWNACPLMLCRFLPGSWQIPDKNHSRCVPDLYDSPRTFLNKLGSFLPYS